MPARQQGWRFDSAGFDLFSFPSNAQLVGFDLRRFAQAQARRGRQRGWVGVTSQHEQFGALAAALTAEDLGLPGTRPEAVLAAQHKLHARAVLQQVAPEANLRWCELPAAYGDPDPRRAAVPQLRQAGEGGVLGAGAAGARPGRPAGPHAIRLARAVGHPPPGRTLRAGDARAPARRRHGAPHDAGRARAAAHRAVQPGRLGVRRPGPCAGRGGPR